MTGFNLTFMTGFGVSAVHGLPDTGLISADEMVMSANLICSSLKRIPCIGDGDTVSILLVLVGMIIFE
jgi:2-methylisocitrate lyase-like PEP mutase family enzyme